MRFHLQICYFVCISRDNWNRFSKSVIHHRPLSISRTPGVAHSSQSYITLGSYIDSIITNVYWHTLEWLRILECEALCHISPQQIILFQWPRWSTTPSQGKQTFSAEKQQSKLFPTHSIQSSCSSSHNNQYHLSSETSTKHQ